MNQKLYKLYTYEGQLATLLAGGFKMTIINYNIHTTKLLCCRYNVACYLQQGYFHYFGDTEERTIVSLHCILINCKRITHVVSTC